jgi:hypothetical protein
MMLCDAPLYGMISNRRLACMANDCATMWPTACNPEEPKVSGIALAFDLATKSLSVFISFLALVMKRIGEPAI